MRREVEAATSGAVKVPFGELRRRFGRERLYDPDREAIARALAAERLEASPADFRSLRKDVPITIRRAPGSRGARRVARGIRSKGVPAMLATFVFVATVVGFVVDLGSFLPGDGDDVEPLSGDLRVAVARFNSINGDGDTAGTADSLAEAVYKSVRSDLAEDAGDFDVDSRGPDVVGLIRGKTPAEVARAAEARAAELGADFLIYGSVRVQGNLSVTTPHFYVSPRLVQGASGLTGSFEGGDPVAADDVAGNLVNRRNLRKAIVGRAQAIAHLSIGVSYYATAAYHQSLKHFRFAGRHFKDPAGQTLIELFLGNLEGKQGRFGPAAEHYREALRIDPGFARARLGLLELRFARARGKCTARTTDRAALSELERAYTKIRPGSDTLESVGIRARSEFGWARARVCRRLVGQRVDTAPARRAFERTIENWRSGRVSLRDLAAESFAILGLLDLLDATDDAGVERAITNLRQAIELSLEPRRKAVHLRMLATALSKAGREGEAESARRKATAIDKEVTK